MLYQRGMGLLETNPWASLWMTGGYRRYDYTYIFENEKATTKAQRQLREIRKHLLSRSFTWIRRPWSLNAESWSLFSPGIKKQQKDEGFLLPIKNRILDQQRDVTRWVTWRAKLSSKVMGIVNAIILISEKIFFSQTVWDEATESIFYQTGPFDA